MAFFSLPRNLLFVIALCSSGAFAPFQMAHAEDSVALKGAEAKAESPVSKPIAIPPNTSSFSSEKTAAAETSATLVKPAPASPAPVLAPVAATAPTSPTPSVTEAKSESAPKVETAAPVAAAAETPKKEEAPVVAEVKESAAPVKKVVPAKKKPKKVVAAKPKVEPVEKPKAPELMGTIELPSMDSLAKNLGYQNAEFKKYLEDFVTSLSQGLRGQAFRRLCARDEETCELLTDFHNQNIVPKHERRSAKHKVKFFRISPENVSQAQRFEFKILVNSLKSESEEKLFELSELSLKEPTCPRNLSAALAVRVEEMFPNPKAKIVSRDLFTHAKSCLQPEEVAFERLFLRQGLYAFYDGDKPRAKELLSTAKKAIRPTERYRVLYWLGRIEFENGVRLEENTDWQDLLNEYPISFYALDVSTRLKIDPIEMITQRKVGGVKREIADDPDLNRSVRWLEALYVAKKSSAVAKWASWIVRANEEDLDVDLLLYISSLKMASGLYRSNISMLFSYFKRNPAALNGEGLRLMYPRPYFSVIQEMAEGKIDVYLVMGLMRQESGFDNKAVSKARAKGLMQIIPQTARRLASQGQNKLFNEKENTRMGVKYLLDLGQTFGGSAELVLAAYNAGPHKVEEWMRRNPEWKKDPLLWNDLIPYLETRDYVVSILRNNYLYARLYGDGARDPKLFTSSLVKDLLLQSNP